MVNERYENKCHAVFKTIMMSLPMILLGVSFCLPTKKVINTYNVDPVTTTSSNTVNGDYIGSTTTSYVPLYQTNNPQSNDEIIYGNIYSFTTEDITNYILSFSYLVVDDIIFSYINYSGGYLISGEDFINFGNSSVDVLFPVFRSGLDVFYGVLIDDDTNSFDNLLYSCMSTCPTDYIPTKQVNNIIQSRDVTTTITNNTTTTINSSSNAIGESTTREFNYLLLKPLGDFYALNINNWYGNMLTAIGLNITTNTWFYYLAYYPLYLVWFGLIYVVYLVFELFINCAEWAITLPSKKSKF